MTTEASSTQNPGSAIGEAIGATMETAISKFVAPYVNEYNARWLTKGPISKTTGKPTKLFMYDSFGTKYSIDGVIVNEINQPIVLLESKYIRYKKHNRDKGSWICQAHGQVRLRYSSVRSSIAVLAGNWSKSSLMMMTTNKINVFVVPFDHIAAVLAKRGINFNWGEKERHLAVTAWDQYSRLTEAQREKIGSEIIQPIITSLSELLAATLSDDIPRTISKVAIEIYSNLGETKRFVFDSREDALRFLEDFSMEEMLDHSSSFTIFDVPTIDLLDEAD
jgi:hypothetical protein